MLAATPATSTAFVTGVKLWSNIVRFLVPCRPDIQVWMSGLYEVVYLTVNVTVLLVPPGVVTLTFRAPSVAVFAITKFAVI
jgi:hypothetical protein